MANRRGLETFAVCALLVGSACSTSARDAADNPTVSASVRAGAMSASPTTVAGASNGDIAPAAHTAFAHSDARGDLIEASKEDDWFDEGTPAPQRARGDIVGVRVQYTTTELVVHVRFADLRPPTGGKTRPILRMGTTVRTDSGLKRDVELWIPRSAPTIPTIGMLSRASQVIRCHLGHAIDVDRGIVTERIPRTCLKDPQWVRVSVNCLTWQADNKTMTLDVALTNGYNAAREDVLSRRIREP